MERRESQRVYPSGKGLKALIYGKPFAPYRIMDISRQGLAFLYGDNAVWPERVVKMDLLFQGELLLEQVTTEFVADAIINDNGNSFWRRGVRFADMSLKQQEKLRVFLDSQENG